MRKYDRSHQFAEDLCVGEVTGEAVFGGKV